MSGTIVNAGCMKAEKPIRPNRVSWETLPEVYDERWTIETLVVYIHYMFSKMLVFVGVQAGAHMGISSHVVRLAFGNRNSLMARPSHASINASVCGYAGEGAHVSKDASVCGYAGESAHVSKDASVCGCAGKGAHVGVGRGQHQLGPLRAGRHCEPSQGG